MKRISISNRVWLVLALFTCGLFINSYLETKSTRQVIESCYEDNVKNVVGIAQSILQHYHSRELSGELTKPEAQRLALEAISAIRYDGGHYIFMGDEAGVSISNGIKELVGTNIMGVQDPTGFPLVRKLYEAAAEGGGFVHYQWPDPDDKSALLPKTSYADYFSPWRWTLGTGLNLESLKAEIDGMRQDSLINLLLVMISIGGLVIYFIHSLSHRVLHLVVSMRQLAGGEGRLEQRMAVDGGKEAAEISESYNQLVASLEGMAVQVQEERQRFLSAVERMQPDVALGGASHSTERTLNGIKSMIRDICAQAEALEQAHESLKEMAEQDPVTGLLSPIAFENKVREQLSLQDSGTPHAFVMVGVSSDQGFIAQDSVTQIAAAIHHLLPGNVLAAYLVDTGFIYWACYKDNAEGMQLAVALQQKIAEGMGEGFDISLGVSSGLGGHKSYELMYSEAERALIRAQKEPYCRVYEY